ncbi:MAG: hypothetical protein KatS3mg097_202 [Candidatus Parcubacteria bacterium]|nr:MAG: hypothetical protein KatS3mg097_202 [Candidatus Parcubacteria bacterium]
MTITKKYFIVDIIPLINLPQQAPDYFSYFSNLKIKQGAIVEINFKKQRIYGFVNKVLQPSQKRLILKKATFKLKPVLKIINNQPVIGVDELNLAKWLKNYACVSLATALNFFVPYKKILFLKNQNNTRHFKKNKKYTTYYHQHLDNQILQNKKTLIITPQTSYINYLAQKIPPAIVITDKKINQSTIEKIMGNNKNIFISVKNGIFLPWKFLDQIIIYHEGSIFYKETFRSPFIDYRKIFTKFSQYHKIDCHIVDDLPSFDFIKNHKINNYQKINFSIINSIDHFEKEIVNFKKTIIFVPQKAFAQKIICHNCLSSLVCPQCNHYLIFDNKQPYCYICLTTMKMPEQCFNCHQQNSFVLNQYGVKGIAQLLNNLNKEIIILEKNKRRYIKDFQQKEQIYLIGSLYLLNPFLKASDYEAFFFINFHQFYTTNDFFLKEKFLRILYFFYKKNTKIFLVTNIRDENIEKAIQTGEIINILLKEREMSMLPPFKRLILLKEGSTDIKKIQQKLLTIKNNLKQETKSVELFGPMFAKPFKQKRRFFLELIMKTNTNLNLNLHKILHKYDIEYIDIDALSF